MPPLRIVFYGTPEFAVPALEALAGSRHAVVGVVAQPDRPRGRGRKLEPGPVRAAAEARGIPVLGPEKVGDPAAVAWLRGLAPDLGCVVAFGQFIPKAVRELPPHGLINAHASLLPRWRGAAPIPRAILAGDARTGVTIIRVAREMDAGDWCLMRDTEIRPGETAGELAARLAPLAASALLEAVEEIAEGRAVFQPQDHERATLAPRIERDFGRLDLSEPADRVWRRIRAASPRPGSDLRLRRSGAVFRILRAEVDFESGPPPRPGAVRASERRLAVGALDGWIEVLRLQTPGRKPLDVATWLRGASVPPGEEAESA